MSEQDEIAGIRAIFIEEAQDIIQRILDDMAGFLASPDRAERFNAILRGVHTIKGGAASCGFADIKDEAHTLESELQSFKSRPDALGEAEVRRILKTVDRFETLLSTGGTPAAATSNGADEAHGFVIFDEPVKAPEGVATRAKAAQAEVIRVPLDRVQKNFDTIAEIFLTRNQLRYLAEQRMAAVISDEVFFRNWEMLDSRLRQNIRDLEHNAMAMRLTSVKSLMRRMEKTVRSFAAESGKDIRVDLVGEDIEIDKLIVDSLAEPLIHLVRNAMDHGIESPQDRATKRKKAAATIRLEVALQGNEALIRVGDDGRGMDPKKILESARRKGLDVSRIESRDEMLNLIFLPGFSTKEAVSEVSGRGVGMDAVKSYVTGLGGSIGITTEIDVGTTFQLRLPLGLSVIPALLAVVNGQRLAIATSDVVEVFKTHRSSIVENDGERFYDLRGQFIPCANLGEHLFLSAHKKDRVEQSDTVSLCICETAGGLVAVQFDTLQTNVEIALKRVPAKAAKLPYVTGVSTLATGEAVFVVSLARLFESIRSRRSIGKRSAIGGGSHDEAA